MSGYSFFSVVLPLLILAVIMVGGGWCLRNEPLWPFWEGKREPKVSWEDAQLARISDAYARGEITLERVEEFAERVLIGGDLPADLKHGYGACSTDYYRLLYGSFPRAVTPIKPASPSHELH